MAETETQNEPTLPAKRKLDDDPIPENDEEQDNHSNKSQKIDSLSNNSPVIQEKLTENSQTLEHSIDSQNDIVQEGEDEDEGGDDSEEAEEDDPLAEVDLDNILPSRTRRKVRYGYLCVVSWGASTLGKLLVGRSNVCLAVSLPCSWFALFVSYNGWVNVTYKVVSGMDTDTLFTTPPRSWPIVPTSVGLNTNHPDNSYKISLLPDFSTRDCTGSHNDSVRRQCVEQLHGPHNCTVLKHKARRIMLSWGANLSSGRLVQSMITKLPVLRSLLYFKVLP
ncbi:hypothetical protein POTOM_002489 [Populus tomentosa]|uniref:Histone chaperone domain-containing protein n=1 Tax=Populus tomentosa TaxID=118781 RepID=A0A8X8DJX6_POPTO|nr:hypothetical protein POTOM_002489 [Populus tomentosa]